ncbi:conserved Plasmodium protein, unknown function [Plasmodium knowlesi strain H]|uniref:Uncharacterized protein n=3 Tax=Plasmodium knowlesi TaxID=5850 RepID=A0A5E7X9G0_PLAKH|nr:conserved Plasmodium protein, unknown function [Plasmodium knowlesi strain H]OTN67734.1 Uncharacterized protein PKNOH_S05393700 [Plasmodium knowlesi]CAA9990524.1 conserved Plasmodium protein, unknown function [Plasmodium knowlesi strain H]SBO19767.1 conserved Plasmodium protein, unknown function [Plasmodium knowlesi strain H]SBO22432.1 conserved Plasmodium protein, unknown function [Plasmodium knowlesi strain H]VVS79998.1 conserved Plasmodium protein, unknown function [Plasmodium knowlesi s
MQQKVKMSEGEKDISINQATEEEKSNNHGSNNVDSTLQENSDNIFSNNEELQKEINKMIQRNVVYLNIKNKNNTIKTIKKNNVNGKKKDHKNTHLKRLMKEGRNLENDMLDEISERRKKNKIKREQKKAKKLEGELKVGNMTVIKDISKMRKCDKKAKNKIYKLSSDVIHKILKKNK